MNIFLIGYRGTGKTTIGRMLAKRLAMDFLDSDDLIEEREGRKIKEIFEREGEPYFRGVEKAVFDGIGKLDGKVVACGGGAVLDPSNISVMRKGIVVLLEADVETIYGRISRSMKNSDRPALTGLPAEAEIKELLAKRKPFYQGAAHHTINTAELSKEEAVAKIEGLVRCQGCS